MNLSDLQQKEIIDVSTGKRLGTIIDVIVDNKGFITKMLLDNKKNRGKLFNTVKEDIYIEWKNIVKLGDDIILVEKNNIF